MSFYETTILADNPVAYFRLDETSGTAAVDATGGIGATIIGTTLGAASHTAELGTSFQFTTDTDRVDIGRNLLAGTAATFEIWVRSTSWTSRSYIIGHQMSDLSGWVDISTDSGGALRFRLNESEGSGDALPSLTLDTWQHIVFTWDSGTLKCYLDGVLSAARTVTGTITGTAPTGDVNLGSRITNQQPFYGYLDEFAVYDYALSDAQVLAHYNAVSPVLVLGNARANETTPARVIVAYNAALVEVGRAVPDDTTTPPGDYSLSVGAGIVYLQSHAFDPAKWQGVHAVSTAYALGDIAFSEGSNSGLVLECTTAGTTAGAAPTFDATAGNTTSDGTAVWTTLGTVNDLAPRTNFYVA